MRTDLASSGTIEHSSPLNRRVIIDYRKKLPKEELTSLILAFKSAIIKWQGKEDENRFGSRQDGRLPAENCHFSLVPGQIFQEKNAYLDQPHVGQHIRNTWFQQRCQILLYHGNLTN